MLEVIAAQLDKKLQTATHAEHDLAAYSGCGGDKFLPDAAFQFTHIVIQPTEYFFFR